jgi:hypothetical protein
MWKTLLALAAAVGHVTAHPTILSERSSCTFTTASAAVSGKQSCTTIVLDNIVVPAGQTLDLTGLRTGTHVRGYQQIRSKLIYLRSSSKGRPPLDTRNGLVHLSQSPVLLLLLQELLGI